MQCTNQVAARPVASLEPTASPSSCTSTNSSPPHNKDPLTDPIAERVRQALFRQTAMLRVNERRKEQRTPYPYAAFLTPLNERGEPVLADTFVVIGKHLSAHGFDFYHSQPVPYRRVLVSLECGPQRWVAFVLDLTWCRFNRNGWYDNGGRFLEVADSPFNAQNLPENYRHDPQLPYTAARLAKESVA